MKQQPEIIGYMIQDDYVIVSNPCTIPIDMLKKSLKTKRKKGQVVAVGMIQIPLKFLPKRKRR